MLRNRTPRARLPGIRIFRLDIVPRHGLVRRRCRANESLYSRSFESMRDCSHDSGNQHDPIKRTQLRFQRRRLIRIPPSRRRTPRASASRSPTGSSSAAGFTRVLRQFDEVHVAASGLFRRFDMPLCGVASPGGHVGQRLLDGLGRGEPHNLVASLD